MAAPRSSSWTVLRPLLRFSQWKGTRVALFAYGPGNRVADFDAFDSRPGAAVWP